jgi:hypothetical protein
VRDGVEVEGGALGCVPSLRGIFERAIELGGARDGLSEVTPSTEQPTPVETPPTLTPGHHKDTPSLAPDDGVKCKSKSAHMRGVGLVPLESASQNAPTHEAPHSQDSGNVERERDADTHQWALSISSPSYVRPSGVEVELWVDVRFPFFFFLFWNAYVAF